MKSLLVGLIFVAFAQGLKAETVEFDEGLSKQLYNILAVYGTRVDFPMDMQTREWARPVDCVKAFSNGSLLHACIVYDHYHNVSVQKNGSIAKKLYDMIALLNDPVCAANQCQVRTQDIKCIHYWPNKNNPPERKYFCEMDKRTPVPPAAR